MMTRALIDIPESKLKRLDELATLEKTSRAALVRKAIDQLLEDKISIQHEEGFGLLKDAPLDALKTQRRLRHEW